MTNLFERLKPEMKEALIKRYENLPNTLNEITETLKNERYYSHLPYWLYADLRFITKEAFGEYNYFLKEYFLPE